MIQPQQPPPIGAVPPQPVPLSAQHAPVLPPNDQAMIPRQPSYVVMVAPPRSQMTAVLLAVFLSFWAFIYTWERDKALFWINLVLIIVTLGFWSLGAWIWAFALMASRSPDFWARYPNGR